MSLDLYQKDLLRFAADASHAGALENPDATAVVNNPLCGDKISVSLKLDGDKVTAYAHDTQACVLCQASAAMIGSVIEGQTRAQLATSEAALKTMFNEGEDAPEPFNIFTAVKTYHARQACVLMPFEAVLTAIDNKDAD